jgi:solute carrier family 25 (mitochondrial adenine nucleotide translocator), member 4/5/6/31
VAPIERVKLLQTQYGNAALLVRARRFRGFLDCVARTVRDEGVLSLWRGNGTAVIRYYPSVALNFSLKVPPLPLPEPANPCRAFCIWSNLFV